MYGSDKVVSPSRVRRATQSKCPGAILANPRCFPRSLPQAHFIVIRETQALPKGHLDHGLSQPLQGKDDSVSLKALLSSVSGMIGWFKKRKELNFLFLIGTIFCISRWFCAQLMRGLNNLFNQRSINRKLSILLWENQFPLDDTGCTNT